MPFGHPGHAHMAKVPRTEKKEANALWSSWCCASSQAHHHCEPLLMICTHTALRAPEQLCFGFKPGRSLFWLYSA